MSVANGEIEYLNGTNFNAVAKIRCSDGHQLNGLDTVTCLDTGMWSLTSECVIRGKTTE